MASLAPGNSCSWAVLVAATLKEPLGPQALYLNVLVQFEDGTSFSQALPIQSFTVTDEPDIKIVATTPLPATINVDTPVKTIMTIYNATPYLANIDPSKTSVTLSSNVTMKGSNTCSSVQANSNCSFILTINASKAAAGNPALSLIQHYGYNLSTIGQFNPLDNTQTFVAKP